MYVYCAIKVTYVFITSKLFVFMKIFLRFLDMHMYVTSALQRTDMKAVGLQLALDLLHEKVRKYATVFVILTEIPT